MIGESVVRPNCSVTVMVVHNSMIGFIRREPTESFPNMLVAPGGKVEMSDGQLLDGVPYFSVEAAAVRELKEETGIDISVDDLTYFCSLTLPNGRVVISMFTELAHLPNTGKLIWMGRAGLEANKDEFAPGMQEEALFLFDRFGF